MPLVCPGRAEAGRQLLEGTMAGLSIAWLQMHFLPKVSIQQNSLARARVRVRVRIRVRVRVQWQPYSGKWCIACTIVIIKSAEGAHPHES